jgi:hypothetical protein
MGMAVSTETSAQFAAYGLLNVGKGVGNILAGPISGLLLQNMVNRQSYGSAKYETIVLFSGTCLAVSAAIIPLSYVRKSARL